MISAKAIKPHTPFKAEVFTHELRDATRDIASAMKKDFEKTTKTWNHNVTFVARVETTTNEATAEVSTKDPIYGYVDKGTKPHIIRPRRGKMLAFKSKYKAKTKPHVINSSKGGASGKAVYAKIVHHPGTEAREFSHDLQAKYQPRLKKDIEAAITRAARRSGHATK